MPAPKERASAASEATADFSPVWLGLRLHETSYGRNGHLPQAAHASVYGLCGSAAFHEAQSRHVTVPVYAPEGIEIQVQLYTDRLAEVTAEQHLSLSLGAVFDRRESCSHPASVWLEDVCHHFNQLLPEPRH